MSQRTEALFEAHRQSIFRRTDRLFAGFLVIQWLAGIAAAVWISPRTWHGQYSQTHPHVWAAVFLVGLIIAFPVFLALRRPGAASTRYFVGGAQMLVSAMLIHLTGGRIETHFHVFGSLAILAFYRDWRVFIPATLVVAADHFLRGVFWPQSVFGVLTASPWRWVEHAGWVLFEDVFLIRSCFQSVREMRDIAGQQAQLETANELIELKVVQRTAELQAREELFRSLSVSAPVGIFQTDARGYTIYVNERWQAISGLTLEESLGEGWTQALPLEDREMVLKAWNQTAQEGREFSLEFRLKPPQGSLCWVHSRATPIRTDSGEVTGYVGTVEDITERKQTQQQLEEQALYLNALVDNIPVAILALSPERVIQKCNRAFETLFQYDARDIVGKKLDDLITAQERLNETTDISRRCMNGETVQIMTRRGRKDGTFVDVQLYAVPLVLGEKVVGTYRLLQDVSAYKKAEDALKQANDKLSSWVGELEHRNQQMKMLGEMDDMLQSCRSTDEAYTVIAPYATQLFPGDSGAVYMMNAGRDLLEAVATWGNPPPHERAFSPDKCWAPRRSKTHVSEGSSAGVQCAHLAGENGRASICVPMMAQGETLGVMHVQWEPRISADGLQPEETSDSRQRRAESLADNIGLALANLRLRETLHSHSIHDELTGLYNRRYLMEYLGQAMARATRTRAPLSVVLLDLDHFKRLNDTFGHDAGDEALRAFAVVLKSGSRLEDVPGRYGGEEFLLVLQDCTLDDAAKRIDRLVRKVRELEVVHLGQTIGPITVSAGLAVYPADGTTVDDILRAADQALYRAKAEGRDRVVLASAISVES